MELRDVIPAVYDEEAGDAEHQRRRALAAIGGKALKMEMCSYISVAG